jgi:hypothetical protein
VASVGLPSVPLQIDGVTADAAGALQYQFEIISSSDFAHRPLFKFTFYTRTDGQSLTSE